MDAVATFQAVIDRYLAACEAHNAAGCAAFYATDGEVHSPFGPPAKGPAEIAAEHRRWFEEGEIDKTMVVIRAGSGGEPGYCLVRFVADVSGPEGGMERFRGTSLIVMERRTDGVWTIKLTSLNEAEKQGTDQDT